MFSCIGKLREAENGVENCMGHEKINMLINRWRDTEAAGAQGRDLDWQCTFANCQLYTPGH